METSCIMNCPMGMFSVGFFANTGTFARVPLTGNGQKPGNSLSYRAIYMWSTSASGSITLPKGLCLKAGHEHGFFDVWKGWVNGVAEGFLFSACTPICIRHVGTGSAGNMLSFLKLPHNLEENKESKLWDDGKLYHGKGWWQDECESAMP